MIRIETHHLSQKKKNFNSYHEFFIHIIRRKKKLNNLVPKFLNKIIHNLD
jgi:hypothetical protein